MSPTSQPSNRGIAHLVEQQLRNWEIARRQRPAPEAAAGAEVAPFVAISRTIGAHGAAIAQELGQRLKWPVFDRELLHAMAGDDQVRAQLYAVMDERDEGWLEATIRWVVKGELHRDDYFFRLTETVLALARKGPAVFLGRATDLILPRNRGLRVRLNALRDTRVDELARREKISESQARAEVERSDRERLEFRKRHFGANANDPANFDLVLSLDCFTISQSLELILTALRLRGIVA